MQNNNADPANLLLGKIGACGSAHAAIAIGDARCHDNGTPDLRGAAFAMKNPTNFAGSVQVRR
ncbi:hypothetical protein [Bradyrhizobium sp. CB1015]|uniref:hypothetical protein n=1 Tax=Bradyrhizobium sp. CB1015 TaxID=2976822 RepID=UPI0021AA0DEF|nr:hypothetical protein [Bradyrhizobium sp. CB1015]UWU94869.1 hypothetical protein N2604_13915 [Bradyrhizobium sp. CB1015]